MAAEAASLICFHGEPERGKLLQTLKALISQVREQHVASASATEQMGYAYLGLTDAAVCWQIERPRS